MDDATTTEQPKPQPTKPFVRTEEVLEETDTYRVIQYSDGMIRKDFKTKEAPLKGIGPTPYYKQENG